MAKFMDATRRSHSQGSAKSNSTRGRQLSLFLAAGRVYDGEPHAGDARTWMCGQVRSEAGAERSGPSGSARRRILLRWAEDRELFGLEAQ
jgi:hypothetical protein